MFLHYKTYKLRVPQKALVQVLSWHCFSFLYICKHSFKTHHNSNRMHTEQ